MNASLRSAVAAVVAGAALSPAAALAGGFGITEFSSKESGRGAAAAALADDPSAIFYNPANISLLPGLQLSLGAAGLVPRWRYTPVDSNGRPVAGAASVYSKASFVPPPHVSLTYNLGDSQLGSLALGIGFYVPYGSSFSWPDGWAGNTQVDQIGLTVYELSPVIAWRPHRMFAVGAGFRWLPANVYLKQAVRFGTEQQGTVELAGSGNGYGASVGISFFPIDGLSFAATWRSPVSLHMSGQGHFSFPPPFDADAHDRDVRTTVPLAEVFRFGVAWDVLPKRLNFSADLEYQRWDTFRSLDISFVNADGTLQTSSSPRNSQNSFVVHVGGELWLSSHFAIRAGYIWDQHTLPEETVNPAPPDSDKHVVSVGASAEFGWFGVDVHFSDVFFAQRTSTTAAFPGQWSGAYPGGTMAYIFGLSLTAKLDFGSPSGAKPAAAPAPEIAPAASPAPPAP